MSNTPQSYDDFEEMMRQLELDLAREEWEADLAYQEAMEDRQRDD